MMRHTVIAPVGVVVGAGLLLSLALVRADTVELAEQDKATAIGGVLIPLNAPDTANLPPRSLAAPFMNARSGNLEPTDNHFVRVDHRRVFQIIHAAERAERTVSERLILNVAEDLTFEVEFGRTTRTQSGYAISGQVAGNEPSAVTLVAHDEVLMGTVWTPTARYEIKPLQEGVHVVRAVAPRLREHHHAPREPSYLQKLTNTAAMDGNTIRQGDANRVQRIDLLILYTSAAKETAGSEAQMLAGADFVVAWTNDALERSGALMRLNLVGVEPIDYEGDPRRGVDLDRLSQPSDGYIDVAHERRRALSADLVSLFTRRSPDSRGVIFGPFSIIKYSGHVFRSGSTFAHEIGHNMGIKHSLWNPAYGADTILEPPGAFNFGYVKAVPEEGECWYTIMATGVPCSPAQLVDYFSTPLLNHPNHPRSPLGVPKSSDALDPLAKPADAVRALNQNAAIIASFMSHVDEGNTPETASIVAVNSTINANASIGDVDYFRIDLTEAGYLRLQLNGHMVATLTGEDGQIIGDQLTGEYIGDIGAQPSASASAQLSAGVYFVRVSTRKGWDELFERLGGPYRLSISFSAVDDHGDDPGGATEIPIGGSITGHIEVPLDRDYFRLQIDERLLIRVNSSGGTDVMGRIKSRDGSVDIKDDDGDTGTNFMIQAKLDPGIYFVEVTGFGGSEGHYHIETSLPIDLDDHSDTPSGATDVTFGSSTTGSQEVLGDRDYFRVQVPAPGQLWIVMAIERLGEESLSTALYHPVGLLEVDGKVRHFRIPVTAEGVFATGQSREYAFVVQIERGVHYVSVRGDLPFTYMFEMSFKPDGLVVPYGSGLLRVINRSSRRGEVAIMASALHERFGADSVLTNLDLYPDQVSHFSVDELRRKVEEQGYHFDGRLELNSDLDIEVLAYTQLNGDLLMSMNETATYSVDEDHFGSWGDNRHPRQWWLMLDPKPKDVVWTFNPASNTNQASYLHLIRPRPPYGWRGPLRATQEGHYLRRDHSIEEFRGSGDLKMIATDDGGRSIEVAWGLDIVPAEAFKGGAGKWRLGMRSPLPMKVMNLVIGGGTPSNLTAQRSASGRYASLPLFVSSSNPMLKSFARVINESGRQLTVYITAIDDRGQRRGRASLTLGRRQTIHFNSDDLESGNRDKRLFGGVGSGEGDWRLELVADGNMRALGYVRSRSGALGQMNTLVPASSGGFHEVVTFNPAGGCGDVACTTQGRGQQDGNLSKLRITNLAMEPNAIVIRGVDDAGYDAPNGQVRLQLAAEASTVITAEELERGAADRFDGRLGDGAGRWRLFVTADQDIQVMSLHERREDGFISNISAGTGSDVAPAVNRPPEVSTAIASQVLAIGADATLDLSEYFTDHQALTFVVASSDPAVVRASVTGSVLTLTGVADGRATISVMASDPDGHSVEQTFVVVAMEGQGRRFRDCDECPELVTIPAGSFMMGGPEEEGGYWYERPVHEVTFAEPFAIGVHEVTFAQWDACVAAGACVEAERHARALPRDAERANHPLTGVELPEAEAYLAWLSERTGKVYRLPSEAEWEYAARAGTTTAYHFGDTISLEQANYGGSDLTRPVGSYPANWWGLHDVHGNVAERTQDCWGKVEGTWGPEFADYTDAPTDGSARETGPCEYRVTRGGTALSSSWGIRSAYRSPLGTEPDWLHPGLRVVRELGD